MSRRRYGGRTAFGGLTMTERKRFSKGRSQSVRATSIDPAQPKARSPIVRDWYATTVPSEKDKTWAHERGQSAGAKGYKEKMEERMRESRARTDTQGYIPQAPARSLSPQVRKSKSRSRSASGRSRSYSGSQGGDDPPSPELLVQLSPSPERLPDMSTWAAMTAQARRGRSLPPDTQTLAERSVTRERSLEQEIREPDAAYYERLIPEKGDPSRVSKQQRGPAWSAGSESMPRALHDVSQSLSGSRSRSNSQKARQASRGSRFNDVIRSESRDPRLQGGYGIMRSLSRDPGDVPVQTRVRRGSRTSSVETQGAPPPSPTPQVDRWGADASGVMHLMEEYRGELEHDPYQTRRLPVIHEPEHSKGSRERANVREERARLARVQSQEHEIAGVWHERTMGRVEYEKFRKQKQSKRAGAHLVTCRNVSSLILQAGCPRSGASRMTRGRRGNMYGPPAQSRGRSRRRPSPNCPSPSGQSRPNPNRSQRKSQGPKQRKSPKRRSPSQRRPPSKP